MQKKIMKKINQSALKSTHTEGHHKNKKNKTGINNYSHHGENQRRQLLLSKMPVQTKLQRGNQNDPAEKEADTIATKIAEAKILNKKNYKTPDIKQAKHTNIINPSSDSADNTKSMTGGRILGNRERGFFEPRMGVDLGGVKIHTDEKADIMAKSINAKAFTTGNSIAFARGEYSPDTRKGKTLLAHELVHTVQQGNKNTLQRQAADANAATPETLGVISHSNGWLRVRLESNNEIKSLAKYTRVSMLERTIPDRERFRIMDWPYANQIASVSADSSGTSRFASATYASGASMIFEKGNKRLTLDGSHWIAAYSEESNPVPNGKHKLMTPDYPHEGGSGYLGDSELATIWFRIGAASSRYLHIGRYSAGCITVGAINSGDESARGQWTGICESLLRKRTGNDSVGEVEVKS